MTCPIVIVSPHPDDAVLSCWHLLDDPGQVSVINVFAGVPPTAEPAGGMLPAERATAPSG